MKTLKIYVVILASVWLATSCEKEKHDDPAPLVTLPDSVKGAFVINEGAFGQSNGDISFIADDGSYKITNLFFTVNNRPLGDVVQSMNIINGKGYIVANNSQKIEVVRMRDFVSTGVINGFTSPRFMMSINSTTAYVSDWSDNNVKIVNLNTLSITGSIPTGNGPEQMLRVGNKVYVANVGGFGNDSTVTIINSTLNTVTETLQVGINPNSILQDATGMLWVLCGGTLGPDFTPNTTDDIGGMLMEINPANDSILKTFYFAQGIHPLKLTTNAAKTKLYFLNGESGYTGNVMVMQTNAALLPSIAIVNREFYGLGVNPANENIYGGIGSFSTNSWMLRYNSTGTLLDSSGVGIGPNGFVFN